VMTAASILSITGSPPPITGSSWMALSFAVTILLSSPEDAVTLPCSVELEDVSGGVIVAATDTEPALNSTTILAESIPAVSARASPMLLFMTAISESDKTL
jgi:hypothetical protein